jgi:hypothetical protein
MMYVVAQFGELGKFGGASYLNRSRRRQYLSPVSKQHAEATTPKMGRAKCGYSTMAKMEYHGSLHVVTSGENTGDDHETQCHP